MSMCATRLPASPAPSIYPHIKSADDTGNDIEKCCHELQLPLPPLTPDDPSLNKVSFSPTPLPPAELEASAVNLVP